MAAAPDTHWTAWSIENYQYRIAADFVRQLERAMESQDITQAMLAQRLNVTEGRVSQVLNNPGNLTLKKIVEYTRAVDYKVSVVAYYDGDPENLNGPVASEIFATCWYRAGSPKDFFELQAGAITLVVNNGMVAPDAPIRGGGEATIMSGACTEVSLPPVVDCNNYSSSGGVTFYCSSGSDCSGFNSASYTPALMGNVDYAAVGNYGAGMLIAGSVSPAGVYSPICTVGINSQQGVAVYGATHDMNNWADSHPRYSDSAPTSVSGIIKGLKMAETTQIMFTHKELVTALVRQQNIHEGMWGLYVHFGLGASVMGPTPADVMPVAHVSVLGIGLQKFDKETNISVDASKVNPKPSERRGETGTRQRARG